MAVPAATQSRASILAPSLWAPAFRKAVSFHATTRLRDRQIPADESFRNSSGRPAARADYTARVPSGVPWSSDSSSQFTDGWACRSACFPSLVSVGHRHDVLGDACRERARSAGARPCARSRHGAAVTRRGGRTRWRAAQPTNVRLNSFDGRPVYRFGRAEGGAAAAAASCTRTPAKSSSTRHSLVRGRAATAWTGRPVSAATVETVTEPDQWMVGNQLRNLRPLWKYLLVER